MRKSTFQVYESKMELLRRICDEKIYFSQVETKHERGDWLLLCKEETEKFMNGYFAISNRILMIILQQHPINKNLTSLYAYSRWGLGEK